MDNIIRLTASVNNVNVGNPQDCFLEIKEILNSKNYKDSDILLFSKLALCPPSAGNLLDSSLMAEQCKETLSQIIDYTSDYNGYLIIGLVVDDLGRSASALAVITSGELIALIPTIDNLLPFINSGFSSDFNDRDSIFEIGGLRFKIHTESLDNLVFGSSQAVYDYCDLYIVPVYEPMVAGKISQIRETAKTLSHSLGIGIAIVNGGISDTSHPYIYNGFLSIFENGEELAFESSFSDNISKTVDFDLDILRCNRSTNRTSSVLSSINNLPALEKSQELLRIVSKNPFLPEESKAKSEYLSDLFNYQTQSLVARMRNTGIDKLVLGVSGGIDSTAALLVAVSACDSLGIPRENIHGITLPGLGTSELTYFNALALLEQLGTSRQDISIRASVLQHFTDISHSGELDTAYENAQARERTQVLMDIANMVGGLVVGSGDLSEEALGFSTFGGDHLANFNVNSCMTKTMLRELLAYIIESEKHSEISYILKEIFETPVSPELLPPDNNGDISQKTEDILGPYPLHEFFLYYFIKYKMKPSKIFEYACVAFNDTMSKEFIKEKLELFIRKFCSNQFKRSCAPDSSSITSVNLLGVNYSIPSDVDPTAFLNELNNKINL